MDREEEGKKEGKKSLYEEKEKKLILTKSGRAKALLGWGMR